MVGEGERVLILPREHVMERYHGKRGTVTARDESLRVVVDLIVEEDGTRVVGETAVVGFDDVRELSLPERLADLAEADE